jgi:hypothetical protein
MAMQPHGTPSFEACRGQRLEGARLCSYRPQETHNRLYQPAANGFTRDPAEEVRDRPGLPNHRNRDDGRRGEEPKRLGVMVVSQQQASREIDDGEEQKPTTNHTVDLGPMWAFANKRGRFRFPPVADFGRFPLWVTKARSG